MRRRGRRAGAEGTGEAAARGRCGIHRKVSRWGKDRQCRNPSSGRVGQKSRADHGRDQCMAIRNHYYRNRGGCRARQAAQLWGCAPLKLTALAPSTAPCALSLTKSSTSQLEHEPTALHHRARPDDDARWPATRRSGSPTGAPPGCRPRRASRRRPRCRRRQSRYRPRRARPCRRMRPLTLDKVASTSAPASSGWRRSPSPGSATRARGPTWTSPLTVSQRTSPRCRRPVRWRR